MDLEKMEQGVRLLIGAFEDGSREGLADTPKRVAKAYAEFWCKGYAENPKAVLKTFEDGDYSEMLIQRDIPIWSLCEHHLAPFFGVAHIGYIPTGRILGLSKLSRLLDVFARRLQVQERITTQVANALQEGLQPRAVGVVLECRHTCMESRGICKSGAVTTTSALRGLFMSEPETRSEFLSFVYSKGKP